MYEDSNRVELPATIAPWMMIRSDNKKMARISCIKYLLYNMKYKDKLPDEELRPDLEIIVSGIDELRHMEENLMQPEELHG